MRELYLCAFQRGGMDEGNGLHVCLWDHWIIFLLFKKADYESHLVLSATIGKQGFLICRSELSMKFGGMYQMSVNLFHTA